MKDNSLVWKAIGALLTSLALFWIKSGIEVNSVLFVLLVAVGIFLLAMPMRK